MGLETVKEECEDAVSELEAYLQATNSCKRAQLANTEIRFRRNSDVDKNAAILDSRFILTPAMLESTIEIEKDACGLSEMTRDVHFGNTIFTAPIMVVNHIRSSLDASDVEISGDGRSICVSERSRSGSNLAHNLKRESIVSSGFSGKHIWYGISLGTLIIMTTIIATMMVTWRPNTPVTQPDDTRHEFYIAAPWFYRRSDWKAIKPKERTYLKLPVHIVILGSTGTIPCKTDDECISAIQAIQIEHMTGKDWNDIAYNFLICANGLVFEGRGANVMGSHTRGFNSRSIIISLVGIFNDTVHPSTVMLDRVDLVIENLIEDGKVSIQHELLGKANISPGLDSPSRHIIHTITNLTHWSPIRF